jgi:hypothetical protein
MASELSCCLVQYVLWGNQTDLDTFYTNPQIRQIYKNHVTAFVNRVNSINGAAFPHLVLESASHGPINVQQYSTSRIMRPLQLVYCKFEACTCL